MPHLKSLILVAAAPALLFGFAATSSANTDGKTCRVTIDRSAGNAGVFDVTRQQDENGDCICFAYTGPETQGAAIESKVKALEDSRTCPSAKLMMIPGGSGIGSGAAGGGLGAASGLAGFAAFAALSAAGASAADGPVSP